MAVRVRTVSRAATLTYRGLLLSRETEVSSDSRDLRCASLRLLLMNTEKIVAALDELIERWTRARDLLASLQLTTVRPRRQSSSRSGKLIKETTAHTAPALPEEDVVPPAQAPSPVTVQVLKPRAPRQRRVVVRASREVPKTALSGSYPTGAVAVSAGDAARARRPEPRAAASTDQKEAAPVGYTLDDLVRELALRSGQNLAAEPAVNSAAW
jgi:hypothetical protein